MSREYIWSLAEGQRFSRIRRMVPASERQEWRDDPIEDIDGNPIEGWFLVSNNDADGTESAGLEVIEVIEIVETRTRGKLALYRQWMVDPDGAEMESPSWVPRRSKVRMRFESVLRGTLNGGGYHEIQQQAKLPKRKLRLVVGDDALH